MNTLELIHVCEDFLVINKPSGVLSLPDGYDRQLPHLRNILEPDHGRLWIVHRLDKDTSGLMLFARNEQAHRMFNYLFSERKIQKKYGALVLGSYRNTPITIVTPLKSDGDRRHRTIVHPAGKPASTFLDLLTEYDQMTLLTAEPGTGLTHQIRAHCSSIGHPILNDVLYMSSEQRKLNDKVIFNHYDTPFSRIALHATYLRFIDPRNGVERTYESPFPPELLPDKE
jgi:RluA family pseudouridine synthase